MNDIESAAIIGLGLIGGSLARDLSQRGICVRGYDADRSHLDAAVRDGFVREALDDELTGVRGADLVVIAVPVDAAMHILERIAPFVAQARLVTDVGSTKTGIVALASRLGIGNRFVGSHPMTGDHRSGWGASRSEMFSQARVYVCPTPEATPDTVNLAKEFWSSLGASALPMTAVEHDRKLAWTSHLPHMVSTAVVLALADAGVRHDELGPGGRDVTRLAGGSPDVWTAIARDNAGAIDAALASAEREIALLRGALSRSDIAALRERFASARAWFDV